MVKLLILDTETTSVEADLEVCEVAATLYNVDKDVRKCGVLTSVSFVLPVDKNEAERVNGVTPELTKFISNSVQDTATEMFLQLLDISDYCVAFNADFDKDVIKNWLPKVDFAIDFEQLTWLCAMQDFDWGYTKPKSGNFSLIHLALFFGIGISTVHRAADDVRLLVEIFNRNKEKLYDLVDKAVYRAKSPTLVVIAIVSYDDRQLAKDAGFSWNQPGYEKKWIKKVKECDLGLFVESLPFHVDYYPSI